MDTLLIQLNDSLRTICDSLERVHAQERLELLQSGNTLPDRKLLNLATESIDLSDRLQRLLQPPSLTLAESFLGKRSITKQGHYCNNNTVKTAYIDTKCLWTAVLNDIPDKISAGCHDVGQLASKSSLKVDGLRKVMQILCNNGIFQYDAATDTYRHSPASLLLTKDHWTQWHNWTDLYGNEFYDILRSLPAALKADESRSAAQIEFNTDLRIFEYFAARGLAQKFHRTLGGAAIAQAPGIVADYDWSSMGPDTAVLDIGGGAGDFLAALLRAHPKMRGAVLELDHVVDIARQNFHGPDAKYPDVAERVVDLHVGDFTAEVPPYEMYVIKWCLHNWADEQVVKILSNVRRAIIINETSPSRLVIVEGILAPGRSGRVSRYADITMMVSVNGLERTREDWERIAANSGWRIDAISTLRNAWCCAIDLRPA